MIDTLGSRMKSYEEPSIARRAFKGEPLVVRLDGKSFHSWTKGLKRPYDVRLSTLMQRVTQALVEGFQPLVGYVQSDEISLVWWYPADSISEYPFNGRFQKIESLTASLATGIFNSLVPELLPEKRGKLALFDSRAFVVPSLTEAYNAILWRQQDATKNAISMAAQSMFSHKSLQGMRSTEMVTRMLEEKGVRFSDYPSFFRRGVFVKRVKEERFLTEAELSRIPMEHRPSEPVERTSVKTMDIWLAKETDPLLTLFGVSGKV